MANAKNLKFFVERLVGSSPTAPTNLSSNTFIIYERYMQKNQKVKVSDKAPFHQNVTGEFQFFGEGISKGIAIINILKGKNSNTLIAVKKEYLESYR